MCLKPKIVWKNKSFSWAFLLQPYKNHVVISTPVNVEDKKEVSVKDLQVNMQCEQEMKGRISCNQQNMKDGVSASASFNGISEERMI